MSAHNLYAPGHPSRDRAIDAAHQALGGLTEIDRDATFSFLDGEVVFGPRVLRELKGWEWATRLISIGMERVEFTAPVGREALAEFIDTVHSRLARIHEDGPATSRRDSQSGAVADRSIRWGSVSLGGESAGAGGYQAPPTIAPVEYSLADELEGVAWLQEQVRDQGNLPVAEATAVVRSLAVAMRQGGKLVLPLLDMAQFSQHMVTHACNVAVLSMGMAEYLGFAPREVSGLGVAALLHDIGNLSLPSELVNKATPYTDADRLAMQAHTVEGAKLLLTRHRHMDLAAVVAYEHHLKLDGTGYPKLRYPREPHFASRVVAVAEVYDAFCTSWPAVPALSPEEALQRVEAQSGRAFDADVVTAFGRLMREATSQRLSASHPIVMVDGELPSS
jgi:putative nucleotidyltransferase with HDIG domain